MSERFWNGAHRRVPVDLGGSRVGALVVQIAKRHG